MHHPFCRSAVNVPELLIVLLVIAAVSTAMLPTISIIRSAARTATCASHLRQLGPASQAYATDWRGYLPAYSEPDGRPWFLQLDDYYDEAGSRSKLRKFRNVNAGCPLFRPVNPANPSQNWLNVSYGMNPLLRQPESDERSIHKPGDFYYDADKTTRFRLPSVTSPSLRFLIGDSNAPMLMASSTGWEKYSGLADPDRHGGLIDNTTTYSKRRGMSGANYLCVDGRVAMIASRIRSEHGVLDPNKGTW